jgi:uncharacterized protein YeaC (DUF1315 family)
MITQKERERCNAAVLTFEQHGMTAKSTPVFMQTSMMMSDKKSHA